jgi:hypothetical protein
MKPDYISYAWLAIAMIFATFGGKDITVYSALIISAIWMATYYIIQEIRK